MRSQKTFRVKRYTLVSCGCNHKIMVNFTSWNNRNFWNLFSHHPGGDKSEIEALIWLRGLLQFFFYLLVVPDVLWLVATSFSTLLSPLHGLVCVCGHSCSIPYRTLTFESRTHLDNPGWFLLEMLDFNYLFKEFFYK